MATHPLIVVKTISTRSVVLHLTMAMRRDTRDDNTVGISEAMFRRECLIFLSSAFPSYDGMEREVVTSENRMEKTLIHR